MLFLLGCFLAWTACYVINRKLVHKRPRQWAGVSLITLGATGTIFLETHLNDVLIWGFVVAWGIGLELFFNCEKYKDYYW
jgi:hypothetical protein